ncbi:MAG: activase, partial [Candidatus Electrothrix sp. AUS1_2]|nr:activase [Candidatus Electrothrix sp. AUS1_2]
SLTLELDSHTADAGLETRIEAFLDIIRYYREIQKKEKKAASAQMSDHLFRAATLEEKDGVTGVRTSDARWLPLSDPKVRLLIPAMSRYVTPLLAAAFGRIGIRTEILESANEEVLKLGRGNASCKECLPLQTTLGGILNRVKERKDGEILVYYMASSDGPCRLGQYHVYTKRVLERQKIRDGAMLTPTSMNGYCNLGDSFLRAAWRAIVIGDLFDEMWSTVLAGAKDRAAGLQVFHEEFEAIRAVMHRRWPVIASQLSRSAARLKQIQLKMPYQQIPKISLIGEMYVRHDPLSLQNIMEKLADRGFIVRTAMISEYIKFIDWLIKHDIEGERAKGFAIREQVKRYYNQALRKRLGPCGLFFYDGNAPIEPVMEAGGKYVSPYLTVESIVT